MAATSPSRSWVIQPCTADQLDAVTTQVLDAYNADYLATNRPAVARSYWLKALQALLSTPGHRALVAVDCQSNRIVGSAFADAADAGYVALGPFSVLPEYADQGIARVLVQQMMQECLQAQPQAVLALIQHTIALKALALYSKLGFVVHSSCFRVSGYVTRPSAGESLPMQDAIQVTRFTQHDVEEADELLKTTLSGVSRRAQIGNMLQTQLNETGIGYVARTKHDGRVVAFTTAANTTSGIWCHASVAAFQALYTYASDDLRTYNDGALCTPSIYMPQQCHAEFRWLLSVGAKIQRQVNLMSFNELTVRSGFTYCPSSHG